MEWLIQHRLHYPLSLRSFCAITRPLPSVLFSTDGDSEPFWMDHNSDSDCESPWLSPATPVSFPTTPISRQFILNDKLVLSESLLLNVCDRLCAMVSREETPQLHMDMDQHLLNYMDIDQHLLHYLEQNDPDLEQVRITSNHWIGDEDIERFGDALQRNTTVTKLDFFASRVSYNAVAFLARAVAQNTTLTELGVRFMPITSDGAAALAQMIRENRVLVVLDLSSNRIGAETVVLAKSIRHGAVSLKSLFLSNNSISNKGATALAHALRQNTVLTNLSLFNNEISDKGAIALAAALTQNKTLMMMSLCNNRISNDGAMAFAAMLERNTTLTELDLSDNLISDSGASLLARALRPDGLFTLDLGANPISSAIPKETALVLASVGSKALRQLYGVGGELQNTQQAFASYSSSQSYDINAQEMIAWLYRSGCGTPLSVSKAKECLLQVIASKGPSSALFLLADILASSIDPKDLRESRCLVHQIPHDCNVYERAQWLLPYIKHQLRIFEDDCFDELLPDAVMDAELQVVALIGTGQFGKVYLARLRCEQWVAVKFMRVGLIEDDASRVKQVLLERFNCRVLDKHNLPHVVKYIGMIDDMGNSQRGLIFDLCADLSRVEKEAEEVIKDFKSVRFQDLEKIPDWSGRVPSSLRSMVVHPRKSRWDVAMIVQMLLKVAEALHEVHKRGFIHRDIADRNILCDDKGNVQLADFGLATHVDYVGVQEEKHDDPILKYRHYLAPGHQYAVAWWAPECVGGESYRSIFSTESDIYALGVVMWQCFSNADPFDHIKPDSQLEKDINFAAREIMRRILNDEKPDVCRLNRDTPKRLGVLMQHCWASDPKSRPMLSEITEELRAIIHEIGLAAPKRKNKFRTKSRDCTKKWFDLVKIYWKLPPTIEKVREDAANVVNAMSFSAQVRMQNLYDLKHDRSPSLMLEAKLVDGIFHRGCPYDGFLIHAGTQKKELVAPMRNILHSLGLRCFMDMEMSVTAGSPRKTMGRALETCRYAVAIVSKEFLKRRYPRRELMYAFRRMEWIRRQPYAWESLFVVLYEVTVKEYAAAMKACSLQLPTLPDMVEVPKESLPDIGRHVVVREWSKTRSCGYKTWDHLCHDMKAEMIDYDNKHAVSNWGQFLEEWNECEDVPLADKVYDGD